MHQDAGGRRFGTISLSQRITSPARTVQSLGSTSYAEPQSLTRHEAEHAHASVDNREERHVHGHVPFKTENRVPDVGGLQWRTKTGHLLKNQSYFTQNPRVNKWDLPAHAGINTWQEWHGPRIRTDADMMERLDAWDKSQTDWEAKKTFVNTTRVQTLDRFYNRKLNRSQYESATNWAPQQRGRRETHPSHELFDSDFSSKPQKELRKVFTKEVLSRDREGIRDIAKRCQNEETWKQVWKQMESERREDLIAGLHLRQAHTDVLMRASGQPVRTDAPIHSVPNSCSSRTNELAKPRQSASHKDITACTDFRGLIHADQEHALEMMFPGFGHELSHEFRARATASVEPGWPAPARPETPVRKGGKRKDSVRDAEVIKYAIPTSQPRLEGLPQRQDDQAWKDHSKVQFLPTRAPPPPDQRKTLLNEDWSPATSLRDPARLTGNGSFTRTEPKTPANAAKHTTLGGQAFGHAPPPIRSYVYTMLAVPSDRAKPQAFIQGTSIRSSPSAIRRNQSEPAGLPAAMESFDPAMFAEELSPKHGTAYFKERDRLQAFRGQATVSQVGKVCKELDDFEESMTKMPNISNFFSTPRKTGAGSQQSSETASGPSKDTRSAGASKDTLSAGPSQQMLAP